MLKKTITFVDYDNNERVEEHYFNLSNAELTEIELSFVGGLSKEVKKIMASENPKEIIKIFKDIILMAYGIKSDDGRRFIKSQELRDSFSQTEAYSTLFMELATNSESAINFIKGIVPSNIPDIPEHSIEMPPNQNC